MHSLHLELFPLLTLFVIIYYVGQPTVLYDYTCIYTDNGQSRYHNLFPGNVANCPIAGITPLC